MGTIELYCRKIEGKIIGLKNSNNNNTNELDNLMTKLSKLDKEMYLHYYKIVSNIVKKENLIIHS